MRERRRYTLAVLVRMGRVIHVHSTCGAEACDGTTTTTIHNNQSNNTRDTKLMTPMAAHTPQTRYTKTHVNDVIYSVVAGTGQHPLRTPLRRHEDPLTLQPTPSRNDRTSPPPRPNSD